MVLSRGIGLHIANGKLVHPKQGEQAHAIGGVPNVFSLIVNNFINGLDIKELSATTKTNVTYTEI